MATSTAGQAIKSPPVVSVTPAVSSAPKVTEQKHGEPIPLHDSSKGINAASTTQAPVSSSSTDSTSKGPAPSNGPNSKSKEDLAPSDGPNLKSKEDLAPTNGTNSKNKEDLAPANGTNSKNTDLAPSRYSGSTSPPAESDVIHDDHSDTQLSENNQILGTEELSDDQIRAYKYISSGFIYDANVAAGQAGNCGPLAVSALLRITLGSASRNLRHEQLRKQVAAFRNVEHQPGTWWTEEDLQAVAILFHCHVFLCSLTRSSPATRWRVCSPSQPIRCPPLHLINNGYHYLLVLDRQLSASECSENEVTYVGQSSVDYVSNILQPTDYDSTAYSDVARQCTLAKKSGTRSRVLGPLKKAFENAEVLLRLDFSDILNAQAIIDYAELSEQQKSSALLTELNAFAAKNKEILGPEASNQLMFLARVTGTTSMAKDTTASQLVGNPHLAVSAEDMCTAANVNMFIMHGSTEEYQVSFGPDTFTTEKPEEFQKYMLNLMLRIRQSYSQKFTDKPVFVTYRSPTVETSSYILNTIGLIPRAKGGDPIFEMINRQLNEDEEHGGVLVICHATLHPLDDSAIWKEFDVVKKWIKDPEHCNTEIILAITKGDLFNNVNFRNCSSVKSVHERIFGKFENALPKTEMFWVTGWRDNLLENEHQLREEQKHLVDGVLKSIFKSHPAEQKSPWVKKLYDHIGIEKLRNHYLCKVHSQSLSYIQDFLEYLKMAKHQLEEKHKEIGMKYKKAAGYVIPVLEHCQELEKVSMQVRLNDFERPSSSSLPLDTITHDASQVRYNLQDEFAFVMQQNLGKFSPSPEDIEVSFKSTSLAMNANKFAAFWMRIERLHSNMPVLAEISVEDLIAFMTTKPIGGQTIVDNFPLLRAVEHCKKVFLGELVPLLSTWVALIVWQSYELSYNLTLQEKQFEYLANNDEYNTTFLATLKQIYFSDLQDFFRSIPVKGYVAFLERFSLREDIHLKMREQVLIDGAIKRTTKMEPTLRKKVFETLQGTWDEKLLKEDAQKLKPADSQIQLPRKPEKRTMLNKLLNKNVKPAFSGSLYLSLTQEETDIINESAAFHFKALLCEIIDHYFDDMLTYLDRFYTTTNYEKFCKVLLKWFFLNTTQNIDADKLSEPKRLAFDEMKKAMQEFPHSKRFNGYILSDLFDKSILTWAEQENVCSDAHPSSIFRQTYGSDIVENFTYEQARASLPGYFSELDPDVELVATKFLRQFYSRNSELRHNLEHQAETVDRQLRNVKATVEAYSKFLSRSKSEKQV